MLNLEEVQKQTPEIQVRRAKKYYGEGGNIYTSTYIGVYPPSYVHMCMRL